MIKIEVQSTRAVIRFQDPLTAGLRGAKAQFRFGPDWEQLIKTAVFRQGDKTVAVADVGGEVTVPWEVLTVPGVPVEIGVYGIDSTGNIAIPTLWTATHPVRPGADPEGDPSTEPTPGLWEQLQGKLGSLEQLDTDDQSSLVAAVNELHHQIPERTSELTNDSGFLTDAPVKSVNGQTGDVHLTIPAVISQLVNDKGYLTEAPVTSVNGQTGDVNVPTAVKVTVTQQSDGTYAADRYCAELLEAHNAGHTVLCQYGARVFPLLLASKVQMAFGCVYAGRVYSVAIGTNTAAVTVTSLSSDSTGANEAVLYTPQDLTEEQKAQARENIGVDLSIGDSGGVLETIIDFTTTEDTTEIRIPIDTEEMVEKIKTANYFHVNLYVPQDTADTETTTVGKATMGFYMGQIYQMVFADIIPAPTVSYTTWGIAEIAYFRNSHIEGSMSHLSPMLLTTRLNNTGSKSEIRSAAVSTNLLDASQNHYFYVSGSQNMAAGTRVVVGVRT